MVESQQRSYVRNMISEFIAVDLGATSGRVAIGRFDGKSITLEIAHRFNHEVIVDGHIRRWDWQYIYGEVVKGIVIAKESCSPITIAFDSWAVDFGFVDRNGQLLEPIVSYRDSRTDQSYPSTLKKVDRRRIYESTGIQFLSFNTIYQLVATKDSPQYLEAENFLMLPDLMNYIFTGVRSTEITNASTTQLLNTSTRLWDEDLIKRVGLRRELFTKLHEPGTFIGEIKGHGILDGLRVVSAASHDTASAVIGTPLGDPNSEAYISSGTWSLVGIETAYTNTTIEAQAANLTNELGAAGTVRLLKNVTGMWLLEECRRAWSAEGISHTIPELLALAEDENFVTKIDLNDPEFVAPGQMTDRIRHWCEKNGLQYPKTPGEFTRCIINSLAFAYKETLEVIERICGRELTAIHIIGGGSQIHLLNQLTADICGIPVVAGPVEATLYGNIAVQVVAAGLLPDLKSARTAIAGSFSSKIYQPTKI